MQKIISIPIILTVLTSVTPLLVTCDSFDETLYLKRLPTGQVYAHLEFVIRDAGLSNHTRLFPRILAEILDAHKIQEMHFSLTQGYWRTESWGNPHVASPTGAHLSAWFSALSQKDADKNWNGFTSRLSGLTCASLNFLDVKTSIEPRYAYRPVGVIKIPRGSQEKAFVRAGNLPRENVCTENLTPWSKLLPCGLSRGLASLLRSKQVFNTHYHSEAIDYIQTEDQVKAKLSITLVLDLPKSLKPTDNFPKRVLGSLAIFPCYPASSSNVKIWDGAKWKSYDGAVNGMRLEDVPAVSDNVELIFTPVKYMGGYGQEYGSMIVEMTNHLSEKSLSVLYVEVLPWFIRPYLHTMEFDVKPPSAALKNPPGTFLHYTPGLDRAVLHKLEMEFIIPPKSTISVSFMVEKGHLKWNEYPPDANHGFYLEAAHFEVNVTDSKTENKNPLYYYSRILLVNLSTPDFSMPYNVICLTCTVVALAFGPIHNITTKQLKLSVYTSKGDKIKQLGRKFLQKFRKGKAKDESSPKEELNSEITQEKVVPSEKESKDEGKKNK